MKVLVVGAGMYVTGRGGHGGGTMLAALAQSSKTLPLGEVIVAARNPENDAVLSHATREVNARLGSQLRTRYRKIDEQRLEDELRALCRQEEIDCALVATPDHTHFDILKRLVELRVHTLVVKPFVASLEEATSLRSLQRTSPVYGAVEFHKRFDESNLYAKKVIESGRLGDLLYMTVDYSQRIVIPTELFRGWAARSNVFQYLGVHYVDLIHFMTGYSPVRLTAYGTDGILQRKGIDTWDSVHAMIEWRHPQEENKTLLSQFNTNWIDPDCSSAMSDQKFMIVGTRGRLTCDQKHRGIELVTRDDGVSHVNPYFSEYLGDEDGRTVFTGYGFKSINQFLKDVAALRDGSVGIEELERHRATFRDAAVSTAVIDAVNRALVEAPGWRAIG